MDSDLLSTADKARRLKQSIDAGMPEEKARQKIMPDLGLDHSPELLEKLLFLGTLCDYPGAQVVSLSALPYLQRFGTDGAKAALQLFDELRPGTNFQKKILSLAEEIALRDGVPAADVIAETASGIPDATHPRARRIEAARDTLLRRRYPRLAQYEEEFSRIAGEIGAGGNVKWRHEPAFEDGRATVTFSFESREELEETLKKLAEASKEGMIEELVRVCNCEFKIWGQTADT